MPLLLMNWSKRSKSCATRCGASFRLSTNWFATGSCWEANGSARPLLLLTGKALGSITPDHLVLSAVVEMIHTATLVHDDVLDDAETRRHLATVNSRWDIKSSVLLGDFLFTHAFLFG